MRQPTLYRQVAGDGCLFPSLAKKATKALDRMGKSADVAAIGVPATDAPAPDLSARMNRRMTRLMEAGLAAERRGDLESAQRQLRAGPRARPRRRGGDAVPGRVPSPSDR